MTVSPPDELPRESNKILFDRTAVPPDQLLIRGHAVEISALPITFTGDATIGVTYYLTFQVVNRIELITTRGRDQVYGIALVFVLPD